MKDRTKQFALIVIRLCRTLPQSRKRALSPPTASFGNFGGGKLSRCLPVASKAEFVSKLGLSRRS